MPTAGLRDQVASDRITGGMAWVRGERGLTGVALATV